MTLPKPIAIILLISIAFFWTGFANEGGSAVSPKNGSESANNHALIIGINSYDHWPELKSPVNDAETITKILTEKYDFNKSKIVLLTDNTKERPTLANILNYLDQFASELTEKDNLLIFFSGHSKEDDQGETYWIPINGKKTTKMTWINHSAIAKEIFASKNFKAKNLCIISDSPFYTKLIRSKAISLTPFDLRYPEKIAEKATLRSREVISFGDHHWPGSKNTEGLGLFAFYICKALLENNFDVIDFENLIFDENILFPIVKIAGTRMRRARFKTSMDKGGQFIIKRIAGITEQKVKPRSVQELLKTVKITNVIKASVIPEQGLVGDEYHFKAVTDAPAKSVSLLIKGKRFEMNGSQTEWYLSKKIDVSGTIDFSAIATNNEGRQGRSESGILVAKVPLVNIVEVQPSKATIYAGEQFIITAKTNRPAKAVSLKINDLLYSMEGSGNFWQFKSEISEPGMKQFAVTAKNIEGVDGLPLSGSLVIQKRKLAIPDIASVEVSVMSPGKGYVGDSFDFKVKTNVPSEVVYLEIEGKKHIMEGAGTEWKYVAQTDRVGTNSYRVIAKNEDGVEGRSREGTFLAKKRPLPIPDVTAVAVSPKEVYKGETFAINVKTNTPAEEVYLEIEGKKHTMEGAGTEWNYLTHIDSIGTKTFIIVANNKEGKQGLSKAGSILITKNYIFMATTDTAARGVTLTIRDKSYEMAGAGNEWSLEKKIDALGTIPFSIVATNTDGVVGGSRIGKVTNKAYLVNVAEVNFSPKKIYAGDEFIITAKTDRPASNVVIQMDGLKYAMQGSGKTWRYKKIIPDAGKKQIIITAINIEGVNGLSKEEEIQTNKRPLPTPKIVSVDVSPGKGYAGDNFVITAKTDRPASNVIIQMDGLKYAMQGSGKTWRYKKKMPDVGRKQFAVIARNIEGAEGLKKNGEILTRKKPVAVPQVVSVVVSPGKGYAGDSFVITAKTDRPASNVIIQMDGLKYAMQGSGKLWRYKKIIPDSGRKQFAVIARNIEGVEGLKKNGEILTRKKPVSVPDVISVDVSPGKGYAGDTFVFQVKTSAQSDIVYIEIEGNKHLMKGTGTDWNYLTQIGSIGTNKFRIIAANKDGVQGQLREGVITTSQKPAEPVNVIAAEVSPQKGFSGKEFTFRANTDRPAKGVALIIGKNRYEMTGSGTNWQFKQKINQTGNINFSVVALNSENAEGATKMDALSIEKELVGYKYNRDGTVTERKTGAVKKRFVDNGDGTVTDLLTSLMWLKAPKTIAIKYEDAVEYCRNLDFKGYSGWRLPTIAEWRKFVDRKQRNPALPPGHPFANVLTHIGYWSKSRHKFGPKYVYQMNLWYGKVGHIKKEENSVVWPVRYAELTKEG
jgi:hypothetical protein